MSLHSQTGIAAYSDVKLIGIAAKNENKTRGEEAE